MFALDPFGQRVFTAARPTRALRGMRVFMGQTPEALPPEILPEMIAPEVRNRLAEVPVDIIRSRRQLLLVADAGGRMPATLDEALKRVYVPRGQAQKQLEEKGGTRDVPISSWNKDDYAFLVAVNADPTEEELRDTALIDGLWTPQRFGVQRGRPGLMDALAAVACGTAHTEGIPREVVQAFSGERGGPPWLQQRGMPRGAATPFAGNPFICGKPQKIPFPQSMWHYGDRIPQYFGLNGRLPWEEIKGPALRTIAMLDALVDYPFPPPISVMPQFWYEAVKGQMQEFVHQDIIINRALARLWITMAVIENYESLSARIIHELKQKAKRQKRKKLVTTIALGITLAVIGVGLAAAFAAIIPAAGAVTAAAASEAVTNAVQLALSAEEKKKAAQDMEKVAKQFEADAPRFAEEARKAAQMLDYQAAQEAAAAAPTLEEAEAIAEGGVEKEVGPEDTGGPLLDVPPPAEGPSRETLHIGGGVVAAAGTAAALLL